MTAPGKSDALVVALQRATVVPNVNTAIAAAVSLPPATTKTAPLDEPFETPPDTTTLAVCAADAIGKSIDRALAFLAIQKPKATTRK
jgi:hypothetical protein